MTGTSDDYGEAVAPVFTTLHDGPVWDRRCTHKHLKDGVCIGCGLALCPFGDPLCPCQDGDPCHYVDMPGSPAMTAPREVGDRR